jgi:hypothetical protein
MNKLLIPLFAIVLLLTGCLTINENITVNSDGSGLVKLTVDMGAIGAKMNQQNNGANISFIDKIKEFPKKAEAILIKCDGISGVYSVTDDNKGIYSIAFSFKNSKYLNKAIYSLFGKKKTIFMPDFITIKPTSFKKKNIAPLLKKMIEIQKKDNATFSDFMFPFINLNSTYIFPRDVKKVSNIKSIVQDNKKVVASRFSLEELLKSNFDFGLKIKY